MAKPRRRVSPDVDEFLSHILVDYISAADAENAAAFARTLRGESDQVESGAFARALLGEGDPVDSAAFARRVRGEGDRRETIDVRQRVQSCRTTCPEGQFAQSSRRPGDPVKGNKGEWV